MAVQYSERTDLPDALLKALKDDSYSDGLEDHFDQLPPEIRKRFKYQLSTTTLARSPRQRLLFNRHSSKLTVDPLSEIWRMFGRVIHFILEHYGNKADMLEKRFGIIVPVLVRGKRIEVYVHGASDRTVVHGDGLVQDYKVTKAESMLYGEKEDHHAQLNVLSYILKKNGFKISKLQNIFLFRNWEERNVKDGSLYPKECVITSEVPMWSDAKTLKYITDRVIVHISAEKLDDYDLPDCTDKERWVLPPTYKVYKMTTEKVKDDSEEGFHLVEKPQMKSKFKSPSRLEAEAWTETDENSFERLKEKGRNTAEPDPTKPIKWFIKELRSKPTRCFFCEIFQFCNQRQAELKLEAESPEEGDDE